MFFRLSLLNLLRHRKRTILIIFAVAMSVLVMELVAGMFEGMREGFFRNLSDEGGHVIIHGEGWEDRLDPFSIEYRIDDYGYLTGYLRELPGTEEAEAVLSFGALLIVGEEHLAVSGIGIDPDGSLYSNVRQGIVAGAFLSGPDTVLVGSKTASLLELQVDDMVSILVEDATGSPFYLEFPVGGIFRTGSESFDGSHFLIDHRAAEELLYMEGGTTGIRVRLSDAGRAEAWIEQAEREMEAEGIEPDNLMLQSWEESQGSIASLLEMMDVMILVMNLLVVIVVASVITNAILMNVFERMAEFGTMRAVGMKKALLIRMVLTEGALQGLLGSITGLALGIPIVLYYSVNGIDWGDFSSMMGTGTSLWYFGYKPLHSVTNLAAGTAIAVGGSLYAAITAAKMSILDNLKQV
jgi:putative ABC transport system permease protein